MNDPALPAVQVGDLLEALPDAHLVTDLAGRIAYLNPAAERLLGYRRVAVVGRDLDVVLADGQATSELLERWAGSTALRPATLVLADGRRLRCDGARLARQPLVQLRLRDHAQAMSAFQRINDEVETLSLRELSNRLDRSVGELRAANQRLEAANDEIQQYARAVAHDIRNPLFTIQGLAHLLTEELPDGSEGARFVQLILESCARLHATTEGVVDMARVEHVAPVPDSVDTETVVADVLADLAGQLRQIDATVVVGPLHPVAVDPTALRRVLQNLIANSLHHAVVPDRTLRIDVSSRRGDGHVELTVADDGRGIDAAEHDRVFDLFHRLDHTAGTPGAGIGLSHCRKTVTAWGGTIACSSRQGPGIRFVFTAPAPAHVPPPAAPPPVSRRRPSADSELSSAVLP